MISGSQVSSKEVVCKCGSHDVVIDTGVCTIPKGSDPDTDPIHYQTYCLNCFSVGCIKLTKDQLLDMQT